MENRFSITDIRQYPIDAGKVRAKVETFYLSNTARLDPKNNDPFRAIFEEASKNVKELAILNGHYDSYKNKLKQEVNADTYEIQYEAFEAWGQSQMSPMEWDHSGDEESIRIEIAKIYSSCNANNIINEVNHLDPGFNDRHQEINFNLAMEYYKKTNLYSKEENAQKNYEALCVYHFAIASQLEHEPSSIELAKIIREKQFSLPENWYPPI